MPEEKKAKINKENKKEEAWEDSSRPVYTRGSLNQVERLIEENLALTKEIHKMTKKIKHHITFQKIVSLFYLFLIIAPIVLSIIYFQPLMKMFNATIEPYKELFNLSSGTNINAEDLRSVGGGTIQVNESTINELLNSIKKSK